MLSAIGVFFAKQAGGLLLGFLSDFLLGLFKTWQANEAQRERGRLEEIAEANQQQADDLAKANAARVEAEAEHAKHPDDDGGFDPEFRRGA